MPVYSTDKGRHCAKCGQSPCACVSAGSTGASDGIIRLQRQVKGRNGKPVVIISGLPGTASDLKAIAKKLKARCGVGGAVEADTILIQGDKREEIRQVLEGMGHKVKFSGG